MINKLFGYYIYVILHYHKIIYNNTIQYNTIQYQFITTYYVHTMGWSYTNIFGIEISREQKDKIIESEECIFCSDKHDNNANCEHYKKTIDFSFRGGIGFKERIRWCLDPDDSCCQWTIGFSPEKRGVNCEKECFTQKFNFFGFISADHWAGISKKYDAYINFDKVFKAYYEWQNDKMIQRVCKFLNIKHPKPTLHLI